MLRDISHLALVIGAVFIGISILATIPIGLGQTQGTHGNFIVIILSCPIGLILIIFGLILSFIARRLSDNRTVSKPPGTEKWLRNPHNKR